MKKIYKNTFLYLLFIYSLFFIIKTSAFLNEDLWDDLYKTLDKSMKELETKMFVKEITANWTKQVYESLNDYADTNCFSKNTKVSSIKSENVDEVFSYISDWCKSKDWTIDSLKYMELKNELESFRDKNKITAKQKTETIYKISRIWLYSDWISKNSPFDLIFDLQEINKVIFWKEIKYSWEKLDFLEKYNNNPLSASTNKDNILWNDWDKKIKENIPDYNDKELEDYIIENSDWNDYLCTDFNNDSWLDKDELNKFTNIIYRNYNPIIKLPDSNKLNISNYNYGSLVNYWDNFLKNDWIIKTWYKKVNDNPIWPCNNFFCINIDFIIHNQEVFWYWWDSKNIRSILEISNWHLKKVANTSLQQAKQATNNFELGLFNINLPEIFHMWFQVNTKPVPLLELENKISSKSNNQDNEKFVVKKQLNFYYKNLWINPERVNDLYIYKKTAENKKNIIDSIETTNDKNVYLNSQRKEIENENLDIIEWYNNTSYDRVTNDILNDFDKQFNELVIFNKSLFEYINNYEKIVKEMKKIPKNKE